MVDDILSVLTLAIFYPHNFEPAWLLAALGAIGVLFALNRWRIYATWPYAVDRSCALVLAAFRRRAWRSWPASCWPPSCRHGRRRLPGRLLAQAATALWPRSSMHRSDGGRTATIDQDRSGMGEPQSLGGERAAAVAGRPHRADRGALERLCVLPLFAFSAAGVGLSVDLSAPGATPMLLGVVLGLVIGKPLGVCASAWLAAKARIARMPDGATLRVFVGAACLCGIGDTVSLLMADQAFPADPQVAAVAKIGVLIGSLLSAALGATIILTARPVAVRRQSTREAADV